jgi:hypothetical protein
MKFTKNILWLSITTLILGMFAAVPVGAETTNANAAQGIEISPALVELNAQRGGTYNITLHIRNVTNSDLVYTASTDDFNSADETGSPHIILDSTLPATASVRTWVNTTSKITIAKQQVQVVNAQITVPNNAEPGGHYGVLRFSGGAPNVEQTGVGLSASVGVLLLIKVDGQITESASVASFYTANSDKQTSFFEKSPITFVTRIKNDGNIHVKPTGSIEIRDMFGNLVKTMSINEDKSNVLPSSIRRFDTTFDGGWMIGRYTADLALGYGTTGQALTRTISFWVIPYKIILAGLLILATVIFILSRMVKVYNKHIINKHITAKSTNENTTKAKKSSNKKD